MAFPVSLLHTSVSRARPQVRRARRGTWPRPAARLLLLLPLLLGDAAPVAAQAQSPARTVSAERLASLSFRSVGPAVTSGRLADVAMDPRNTNVWYVATASGGLWKTVNRGLTFEPVFDAYGSYTTCCVLVDPSNSDVVWLATGENTNLRSAMAGDGIWKSTDAGRTWQHVGLGRSEKIGRMAIDPRNTDVVYIAAQGPLWASGGERGLYRTANGGRTWERVLHVSDHTGISDVVLDPRNPDVVYAASYQRRRNVGILIGGGPEGAIYKSTDAGRTWNRLSRGLPTRDVGRIGLAISPQNPDVVYATIASQGDQTGFYRSADRGETWTKMSDWIAGDPQFYGEIFPDPFTFDKVWAVAVNVHVTTDGGRTFQPVQMRGVHVDHHHIGFDPRDPKYMMVGNDGGLYDSYDGGETWRHFRNLPVTQYYRIAVDDAVPFYHIYGGTQDNGTPRTPSSSFNPAGIRESETGSVFGGDGFQPRVDPRDPNIIYAMSQDANIARIDGRTGASTSIRPPRVLPDSTRIRWHWDVPLILSPHNPDRLYTLGSRLFRSDDRGDNWRVISPDVTRQIDRDTLTVMGRRWGADAVWKNVFTNDISIGIALDESPLVEGLLYTGTDDGVVSVSENGGQTWRRIERFPGVPEGTWVSEVLASRHDPNVVYAAFNNQFRGDFTPYLLRSSDRGRTWTSIRANLPDRNQVWTLAQDHVSPNLIFAGTEHGVYVTLDGGAAWHRLQSGLPAKIPVRDIELQRRENDLVLGTFGRGIYILDDYSALRHVTPAALAQDAVLFAPRAAKLFHPTPFERGAVGNGLFVGENAPYGAILTYHVGAASPGDLVLTIRDERGAVVRELPAPAQQGIQRVVWNLRAAPAAPPAGRGGGPGQGQGQGQGELVRAGTYSVQLGRRAGGAVTALGEPRRLDVVEWPPR